MTNQATTLAPSLLAPPSSPASFSNSALPSTAQSPSCFLSLSANSPGGPSSAMYATGPYAHETQLVSPPVFSTFTTEPSTAPLTPPPELAHLTTPSSPDVPFAQFLTSSARLKSSEKGGYSLSSSFPEREFPPQWDPSVSPQNGNCSRTDSGRLYEHDANSPSMETRDSNFFCPATFARFYLDHNPPFPHTAGRLSVSKDSDVYPAGGGNGHQNRNNKSPKQDVEEIEAYRASFGFSADEIITTTQYVEISDVHDDSFVIAPLASSTNDMGYRPEAESETQRLLGKQRNLSKSDVHTGEGCGAFVSSDRYKGRKAGNSPGTRTPPSDDDIFSQAASSKASRKYNLGQSISDAEIDYRRVRSSREGR
ncbi:Uncharacterized protein At1g76660 [Linum grandiflorum]